MASHSPGTDQIDTLLWIGFIAAAILVVAVNAALIYALRRRNRDGGADAGEESNGGRGLQLRVGGALGVFAVAILVLSIVFTEKASEAPATGPDGLKSAASAPLRIEATGQQWLWRYDYPNEAFSYYRLVVPVDTTVSLDLVSTDVVHTWNVPELAGKRDAVPGKHNEVVFRADEEGEFTGDAATLSGQAYAAMRTEVDVVSPEEYEAFIKEQKDAIQEAQDHVVKELSGGEAP